MELEKAWKIGEFSKLIDKHYNTVDQWFKALENRRIHYVNRIMGEKVYNELDLEIGKYIKESRDKEFSLRIIFEQLPSIYELRPFPPDWSSGDSLLDIDSIKRMMESKFDDNFQIAKSEIMEEVNRVTKELFEEQRKLLPPPKSPEEQKTERINEMLGRMRVERKLEDQAIQAWTELPDSERVRRVGLFRKDEDWGKREAFIRRYVHERIESALKEEYGVK